MNENELLKFALENGMLDVTYVQEQMDMNKRKEYLSKHPNSIWQGKDGNWYTKFPDEKKGKVLKKRKNKKDLEDCIINFWKEREENPTVKNIFQEWINGKYEREEIQPATKDRYERQFLQCFSEIANRRIKSISEYEIEEFVLNSIYNNKLTQKAYSNMRTIIYGVFKLAKKKRYVDFSITQIINDMELSRKIFRNNIKENDEEVFTETELPVILDYLENNLDLINLGILLVFKTGLRIGELVALKKEDVEMNVIHVRRTEVKYKDNKGHMVYEVRDFPKTEAGIRDVFIPDSCIWILKRIKILSSFGEYLFERKNERIRTYSFNNRLQVICKKCNIKPKSPHKIRKTYGTILIDSGVEESLVLSQMGHKNISTTMKHYYRDRDNKIAKAAKINEVIGL